jgi:hypothetical protein
MELLKEESPLEFSCGDAVFLVKARATAHDKLQLDLCATSVDGNVANFTQAQFADTVLKLFVVGWKGVTRDGKPAPYSYETLKSSFPSSKEKDVLLELVSFIVDKTDVFKRDLELKKD